MKWKRWSCINQSFTSKNKSSQSSLGYKLREEEAAEEVGNQLTTIAPGAFKGQPMLMRALNSVSKHQSYQWKLYFIVLYCFLFRSDRMQKWLLSFCVTTRNSKKGLSSSVLHFASHHRPTVSTPDDIDRKLIDFCHPFNRNPAQSESAPVYRPVWTWNGVMCLNSLSWTSIRSRASDLPVQPIPACNNSPHSSVSLTVFGVWVERGIEPTVVLRNVTTIVIQTLCECATLDLAKASDFCYVCLIF